MACGSIYALVPFLDRRVLGGVCGIIGAGGNVGGVAAGLLLRFTGKPAFCFEVLGIAALLCACGAGLVRFSARHKQDEQALYDAAVAQRAFERHGGHHDLGTPGVLNTGPGPAKGRAPWIPLVHGSEDPVRGSVPPDLKT